MRPRNASGDRARIILEEYNFLRSFGYAHERTVEDLAPRMGVTPGYLHDIIKAQEKVA